ncbi:MAG TPA: branched-chain amino acid transport system II carrier protein [Flavobacterium sp.]|nr:branched-chain amino acid transport system II carrier protein [Flavobacterium sp.]
MAINKKNRSILVLGMAVFAMLFGAGNLLLPPQLGFKTGADWFLSYAGFSIMGVLAPLLAIWAVLYAGNYFTDVGKRANKTLGYVLATIIVLCIGPLIAIPRTGAFVYETAVLPLNPDAQNLWALVLFFAGVLTLSFSYEKTIRIIGRYMAPVLICLLAIFILLGLFTSGGINQQTSTHVFSTGFIEGYNTLDVLGAVIFAVVLISGAKNRGYTDEFSKKEVVFKSSLLAAGLMLVFYAGLFLLGSLTNTENSVGLSNFLVNIAQNMLDGNGIYLLALLAILTGLTTAMALTAAVANFFDRLTNKKLGYAEGVIMCTLIAVMLAINGVEEITAYAAQILTFVYPITLILILTVLLFGRNIVTKTPYLVALIITSVFSVLRLWATINPSTDFSQSLAETLPLYNYQLEWIIPSFVGFWISFFMVKKNKFH